MTHRAVPKIYRRWRSIFLCLNNFVYLFILYIDKLYLYIFIVYNVIYEFLIFIIFKFFIIYLLYMLLCYIKTFHTNIYCTLGIFLLIAPLFPAPINVSVVVAPNSFASTFMSDIHTCIYACRHTSFLYLCTIYEWQMKKIHTATFSDWIHLLNIIISSCIYFPAVDITTLLS